MTTEEHYDVVDEKGNKTGQTLPKSEVHEKELWHASVFVWIYNSKGEVLLQRRAKDKKSFPDVWDVSVAGHITAGDSPEETAIREIKEEIGVSVVGEELVQIDYTSDIVPWLPDKKHPEFCWVYVLHKDLSVKNLKIQKSELSQVKWMPVKDLLLDLRKPDSMKTYAARNPRIFASALERLVHEKL